MEIKRKQTEADSVQRVVILRRRSKLGRLLKVPTILKHCWKFTDHPAIKTSERVRFCWSNICVLLKG
jgi:hypothetical protein